MKGKVRVEPRLQPFLGCKIRVTLLPQGEKTLHVNGTGNSHFTINTVHRSVPPFETKLGSLNKLSWERARGTLGAVLDALRD